MTDNCWNSGGGAGVKMEHFQATLDPRKQELLEARFLGARVYHPITKLGLYRAVEHLRNFESLQGPVSLLIRLVFLGYVTMVAWMTFTDVSSRNIRCNPNLPLGARHRVLCGD